MYVDIRVPAGRQRRTRQIWITPMQRTLLSSHAKEPHACRKRNVEIKAAKPTVHSLLICARRAMIRTTRTHTTAQCRSFAGYSGPIVTRTPNRSLLTRRKWLYNARLASDLWLCTISWNQTWGCSARSNAGSFNVGHKGTTTSRTRALEYTGDGDKPATVSQDTNTIYFATFAPTPTRI
jgi:hypothetical protein